jgi:hypothetical protein
MEANKPILHFSPILPIVDIEFWLWFTAQKLDHWKLECPPQQIFGHVSMPLSKQVSSNLLISSPAKKESSTGGILEFRVEGLFLHFNTIEEYNSF